MESNDSFGGLRWVAALAAVISLLAGCGRVPAAQHPGDQVASGARSPSPTPTPSTSSEWQIYTDHDYHFIISYPPGFTFIKGHGVGGTSLVMSYRAVEPKYLGTYPPGEFAIDIYTKDADSLSAWVSKHTGPVDSPDHMRYWYTVSNQVASAAGGQQALAFEWMPEGGPPVIHDTAIFLGDSYVLTIAWFSSVSDYSTVLQQYYARMLGDLQVS